MYTSDLKGMVVLDKNAKAVGKVEDVEFSPDGGHINGVLVSLKKGIFSRDSVNVPFDEIAAIGDYIILKKELPKDEAKVLKIEKSE